MAISQPWDYQYFIVEEVGRKVEGRDPPSGILAITSSCPPPPATSDGDWEAECYLKVRLSDAAPMSLSSTIRWDLQ